MCLVRFPVWAVAALLFVNASAAEDQPAETPTFSVRVNTVSIDVEVLDQNGDLVTNLAQSDFVVKENGKTVPISNFSRWNDRPVSLAIILDTSTIRLDKLSIAKEHIMQMLHLFERGDELSFFSFDTRDAWLEADRSNDWKQIIDALDNISVPSRRRGSGGRPPCTALAIDMARMHLEKSTLPRKALLLVSNRFSGLGPDTVDNVRESGYSLFWLGFKNKSALISLDGLGDWINRNQMMRDSGGRRFSAENEDIAETSRMIVTALKNYYSIGYQTEIKPGDTKRRQIEVTVPGKKYTINARRFYTPQQSGAPSPVD